MRGGECESDGVIVRGGECESEGVCGRSRDGHNFLNDLNCEVAVHAIRN